MVTLDLSRWDPIETHWLQVKAYLAKGEREWAAWHLAELARLKTGTEADALKLMSAEFELLGNKHAGAGNPGKSKPSYMLKLSEALKSHIKTAPLREYRHAVIARHITKGDAVGPTWLAWFVGAEHLGIEGFDEAEPEALDASERREWWAKCLKVHPEEMAELRTQLKPFAKKRLIEFGLDRATGSNWKSFFQDHFAPDGYDQRPLKTAIDWKS